jgi:type IV pilus assembly protein PilK
MPLAMDMPTPFDWVDVLAERFSVEIDEHRTLAFNSAIARFAASLGEDTHSLGVRAQHLELNSQEWGHILHLATNHETRFFRYMPVIRLITGLAVALPCPRILSVGCSTGEEAYSIAAALIGVHKLSFAVHGIDISERCIQLARAGEYPAHPDIGDSVSYLSRGGKRKFHLWLRDLCTFEQHNIAGDTKISFERPDIIVTQNMLIYYRVETRHQILERLAGMLAPGGHLITGPAEDAGWKSAAVSRVQNPNASVFLKV